MNIYDKKLIKLKDKAKLRGYNFINNKFKKDKQKEMFVLNLKANTFGSGVYIGNYELFDKMYIITEEQKNKLSKCNNLEQVVNLLEDIIQDKDYERCNLWEDLFCLSKIIYFNNSEHELSMINKYKTYLSVGMEYEPYNVNGCIQVFKYPIKEFEKYKQVYFKCFNVNDDN